MIQSGRTSNVLTVEEYFAFLDLDDRNRVDAWLRAAGGDPKKTYELELVPAGVRVGEYVHDEKGHPQADATGRDVLTTSTTYTTGPPPVWPHTIEGAAA